MELSVLLVNGMCGGGAACEEICPVMRIGRACPGILEVLHARHARGLTSSVADLLRPLELV